MSSKVSSEREQSRKRPSLITSLPDDVIMDIVARVPVSYYPIISLVSKSFRSLLASPELYTRRSLLGCTEHCLYVVLFNYDTLDHRLCIFYRKVNNNRLVIIRSIPLMTSHGSYVAVGSKIYVFNNLHAFSIDCRSHTVQPISDIPKTMYDKVADIIDRKIYVIGNCYCDDEVSGKGWRNKVIVFDTECQIWEPVMISPDIEIGRIRGSNVVVMEGKIYLRDNENNSFVYEPKESKWETDEKLSAKDWKGACVCDDVLYYYDICKNKLTAYDPKQRCWSMVKGLDKLLLETTRSWSFNTVSYGRKLALFFQKRNYNRMRIDIWCAEIALERGQGGEIWGKVQWCDVMFGDGLCNMEKCLVVTV